MKSALSSTTCRDDATGDGVNKVRHIVAQ